MTQQIPVSTETQATGRVCLIAVAGAALATALWLTWWPLGLTVLASFLIAAGERWFQSKLVRALSELGMIAVAGGIGFAAGPVGFGLVSLAACVAAALTLTQSPR
ncbi:MAG: hypothetical protein K2W93_14165 [Burkholderiaceae bacterium]|nr:hypothetical protein [Burkholderiaceae bacterium]